MTLASIGDLAQSFVNRSANTRINRELSTLAKELTTGVVADPGAAASGDVAGYAALERVLSTNDSYLTVARETGLLVTGQKEALGTMSDQLDRVLSELMLGEQALAEGFNATLILGAKSAFDATVTALNTQLGDRFLFSGIESATRALRDSDAIMADVQTAVSAATNATDAMALIDVYFAPGGGFDANDYTGAVTASQPVDIAPGEQVTLSARADQQNFRDVLANYAKLALLNDVPPILETDGKLELLRTVTDGLLNANTTLIENRASLGVSEARIESARASLATERAALQSARLDRIGADPYETASMLEQTQLQLEQLYTVTARLSRLSLVNYL